MLRNLGVLLLLCSSFVSGGVINAISDLPLDENERLSSHYLLHTKSCKIPPMDLAFREVGQMGSDLAKEFFGEDVSGCTAICLERGTSKEHLLYPLPIHVKQGDNDLSNWVTNNCQKVDIGFLLYTADNAHIYWIDHNGKRVKVGTLQRGERHTAWHTSYIGHVFEVVDVKTDKLLGRFTVKYNEINSIGDAPNMVHNRDVTNAVRNTLYNEWDRAHRVKRTFTEFGFNRGKLPVDLWGSISAYYYNNRNNKVLEEWDSKGLFVNWWETNVYFIPMPWELKRYWQGRLKDLVEKWSGTELELTDIYGLRRYEDGARLLTHVDRENTHAASLIINIAQGEIRKPWKVEIYDHADRLHEVEMDEGDIVYYESARCLHGRMNPLEGGFYVNLFAHYRPIGDPMWFEKQNPSTQLQQPILDIGDCHSNGTHAVCTGPHHLPYLNKDLERLTGPNDLFTYWQKVSPPPKNNSNINDHGSHGHSNGEKKKGLNKKTKTKKQQANDEL